MRHIRDLRVGHDLVVGDQGSLASNVSPVNNTSSCDSEMSVTTGLVASLAKSFPFLRSNRLRFGCGLVRCSSSSSLGAGVVLGADGGAPGGDGERRQGGGVGERREAVLSSSHVDVASSSSRRLLGLGAGAGSVRGGNNMVRYCWMMGLSFFPSWKA